MVYPYRHKISDLDQLKRALINCWTLLSQDTLNRVINQLEKRLTIVIKAKGGHVEIRLDKFCMHKIAAVTFSVCSS